MPTFHIKRILINSSLSDSSDSRGTNISAATDLVHQYRSDGSCQSRLHPPRGNNTSRKNEFSSLSLPLTASYLYHQDKTILN